VSSEPIAISPKGPNATHGFGNPGSMRLYGDCVRQALELFPPRLQHLQPFVLMMQPQQDLHYFQLSGIS
jgi:hypothetical protein